MKYFLTAEDRKFEERKQSESEGIVGGFINKIKRSVLPIDDLKINSDKKNVVRMKANSRENERERRERIPIFP